MTFGSGIEPPQHTPSTIISDGPHRTLRKFHRPDASAPANSEIAHRPVLLVPPLAAPATCFDLRPGQSLAAFLLENGRVPYLIDYGTIDFSDRHLGFEEWIDHIIPTAIRRVSEEHGGAPVDLVCWCLGGTMSLLAASAHPDLPIRSITAVATPIDYSKLPTLYLLRGLARFTGGRFITMGTKLLGGVPAPLVRLTFRATAFERELKKPVFIAKNLANTDALVRMEAIERFMGEMPAYPGKLYVQLWKRIMVGNDLAHGGLTLGSRRIAFKNLRVPVLAIAGTSDAITSVPAARALQDVLTSAPSVQFETAAGSHLGVLAGPTAKDSTWSHIDTFLTEQDAAELVTT